MSISLFLPQIHTKKRSILLRHHSLIGIAIFLIMVLFLNHSIIVGKFGVLGYAENISVSDLLKNTNQVRSKHGVQELKLNDRLSRAAKAKAEDMFNNNYWAHTSPSGKEPWDFIIASGYDYLYAGENLAVDFNNSDSVVDAWFDSASHRQNLLNDKYSEIGFAVVNGELDGRETTLVVQMFGYPRSVPPAIAEAPAVAESPSIGIEEIAQVDIAPVVEVEESISDQLALEQPETPIVTDASGQVLNASDVLNMSRALAVFLGLFLTGLFALDGYYIHKLGVLRVSGHTILHVFVLIMAMCGIWYTSIGLIL